MSELPPPPASPEVPPPERAQGGTEAEGRQFFLWALVGGLVPVCGLPVAWGLALLGRRRDASPAYQRWYRRLVALAILDTLVALASLHVAAMARKGDMPQRPLSPPKVLGIALDPEYPGPGLRLLAVDERGPAAQAGMRQGDVVLQAQGRPVETVQELRGLLQGPLPEGVVQLEVEREGAKREVRLQPVEASALAPPPRGLFEVQTPEAEAPGIVRTGGRNWLGLAVAMGALLVLWVLGWRRGADARPLYVLGVLVAAGLGALLAARGLSALLGGTSRGVVLLSAWAQGLILMGLAAALVKRGARTPEEPAPHPWFRIYLASLGLLITLGVRTSVLLGWAAQMLAVSPDDSQHPMTYLARGGPMGAAGWVLLVVPAVLLAPVGEELLFRGVLLPWLSGWMGRVASLTVSAGVFASLHLFYGVFTGSILFLGLLMGWARVASGGLRAPILLHMTINGTAMLLLALGFSG